MTGPRGASASRSESAALGWADYVADAGPDAVLLRPGNLWFPLRRAGREVRLLVGRHGVVLRRLNGDVEVLVRPGEVHSVRYCTWLGERQEELLGLRSPTIGGGVELLDGDGRSLLLLAGNDWTPGVVHRAGDDPPAGDADMARLEGATDVAEVLGVPLHVSGERLARAGRPARLVRPGDDVVTFGNWLPAGLVLAGVAAFLGCVVVVRTNAEGAAGALAAVAVGLFVATCLLRYGQFMVLHARERVWRLGAVSARLTPRPGVPVPRRFQLRAAVKLTGGGEVVCVLPGGRRRWLGGPGERLGVARAELVTYDGERPGHPAGARDRSGVDWVDFRDRDGRLLARFRWEEWFAGQGGEAALREFCAALGVPVGPATRGGKFPDTDYTFQGTSSGAGPDVVTFLYPGFYGEFPAVTAAGMFAALSASAVKHVLDDTARSVLLPLAVGAFVVGFGGTLLRFLPGGAYLDRPSDPPRSGA